jgi:hypothetical protein
VKMILTFSIPTHLLGSCMKDSVLMLNPLLSLEAVLEKKL